MVIAIIGTGHVGTTLATALQAAGHEVRLGSRTPGAAVGGIEVVDHTTAIAPAGVVVNAVAGAEALATFTGIGAEALAGKVLLDLANAVGSSMELLYPEASLGEQLQAALPQAHVVKSLNTVTAAQMVGPGSVPGATLFVSGDDDGAKATVRGLLGDLGWPDDAILDLGGITSARGAEHYFPLFFALMQSTGGTDFALGIVRSK